MKGWIRTLALYAPAVALLVAGVVGLLTQPLYTSGGGGCAGSSGPSTYGCPAAYGGSYHLAGPMLLLFAGADSLIVFAIARLYRGKSRSARQSLEVA